ncbi:DUF4973 domain-containing protein [Bacteroides sp.]|uniref:DUF4973 domain-containing protein n=1 Tax=Bacteroides sp. TaxID=29523 RepID=UPI002638D0D2|nr:DUF4973 domain-containing protein [Bacteroides sp.]MDD3036879.1 DUF4973 domain-containing protein [Bacteroides sp.]
MKKVYILGIALGVCVLLSSCNDEWKDELYGQMISFKAPIASNGVNDIYIRYQSDGSGLYKLPVIVSGSQDNNRDIDVKIGVDNDTLSILNTEKYLNRQDLWYKQLPDQFYSFPNGNVCRIPAGKNVQTYDIDFHLAELDLNEKWVLPLTIEESSSYTQNIRKGYYKALLNIRLFNDYSGTYTASGMNVYLGESNNDPATVNTRSVRVVDDKSIFFYAGTWWEEDENRHKYKVIVEFGDGVTDEDGVVTGQLTVKAGDTANEAQIKSYGQCKYMRSVEPHKTQPYIELHTTVMYLNYYFTDITSDPNNPIRYRVTGSMTMQRQINTLIPDKDQAILW